MEAVKTVDVTFRVPSLNANASLGIDAKKEILQAAGNAGKDLGQHRTNRCSRRSARNGIIET